MSLCAQKNWTPFSCLQPEYNLVTRATESELIPACQYNKLAVFPWSPLAGGLLSGKYRRNVAMDPGSRAAFYQLVGEGKDASEARIWNTIEEVVKV